MELLSHIAVFAADLLQFSHKPAHVIAEANFVLRAQRKNSSQSLPVLQRLALCFICIQQRRWQTRAHFADHIRLASGSETQQLEAPGLLRSQDGACIRELRLPAMLQTQQGASFDYDVERPLCAP